MDIIDTHCHAGLNKYEPVESLLYHMQDANVGRAVLIQHQGNTDNRYLLDCMAAHPGRFAAAMLVDKVDDGTRIRKWAEAGMQGIRLAVDSRADGPDPLVQWRTAAELNLVVSAPCTAESLLSSRFQEVLTAFPGLEIVIEHLIGAADKPPPSMNNFERIMELSAYPNLTVKLTGFGEFCSLPYPFSDVPPYADRVVDAFGPKRVMWGSDFPPVSCREGYRHALEFPMEYFRGKTSAEDLAWIFGRTAAKVWKF